MQVMYTLDAKNGENRLIDGSLCKICILRVYISCKVDQEYGEIGLPYVKECTYLAK